MQQQDWQKVKDVFALALEQPKEQRADYLREVCADDSALRAEVESLLEANDEPDPLIERNSYGITSIFEARSTSYEGKEFGRYKVIREIGRGGMGAVYLARRADDEYRKFVALKIVRRGMDTEDILRRFRNERQILAALDHPNIARLLDGGTTDDGLPYLVMEYVEGTPITDYCDSHRLPTNQRLELFRTVCAAVQHAHQNLVVHRDLKPSNILVTADGTPKLLDFGIAKVLNPELTALSMERTRTELRVLTPDYASPEQLRGEKLTTPSDIYSLGVVLYELLTGHRPYRSIKAPPHELARAVCEQEPAKPSAAVSRIEVVTRGDIEPQMTITPETVSRARDTQLDKLQRRLSGDLDNIVLMAMRKEPQRRYASVEQLSEDIRRHLDGLPVIARKDTFSYRTSKFVQRHRVGVSATVLIVLAVLAGFGATVWQWRIARAERAEAQSHFNDVRQLANSFLFEFHDAIEKLPGSTPARELVVRRALEYLDRLAQKTTSDLSLQLELATAYARVGNIQWARYYANLGDTDGALQSQRKALAIREAVLAADPTNAQAKRDLAFSYLLVGDLLVAKGVLDSALDSYRKSLKIRQEIVEADPRDVSARENLRTSYQRVGDTLGNPAFPNLGDRVGALENYRKMQAINEALVAEDPANANARHGMAIGYEKIARILAADGDLAGALELYRKELVIFRELAEAYPTNAQFRRDLTIGYGNVGDTLAQLGDREEALENLGQALKLREEIVATDRRNAGARLDLAFIIDTIANVLATNGDHVGALEHYRRALTIFEELYAADASNQQVLSRLARTLKRMADVSVRLGQPAQAHSYGTRSLSLGKAQATRPGATANDLSGYARSLLTVEPPNLRDPIMALSYAKRVIEMTKGNDPNLLDTLALAYHLTGDHARAIETAEKALTLLKVDSPARREFEANLARFKAALKGKDD